MWGPATTDNPLLTWLFSNSFEYTRVVKTFHPCASTLATYAVGNHTIVVVSS